MMGDLSSCTNDPGIVYGPCAVVLLQGPLGSAWDCQKWRGLNQDSNKITLLTGTAKKHL